MTRPNQRGRRILLVVSVVAIWVAALFWLAVPASACSGTASVTVVEGLNALSVAALWPFVGLALIKCVAVTIAIAATHRPPEARPSSFPWQ